MKVNPTVSVSQVLLVKGLLAGLVQVIGFAILLFLPAGTLDWPRGIQFLLAYSLLLMTTIAALAQFAPSSLEARLQPLVAVGQPKADQVITTLLFFGLFFWFIFIPIEVFHLKLFPKPSLLISISGAITSILGYSLVTWSLFQNEFMLPIVKSQPERGQVLIDRGIYRLVRHPFYLGFILFLLGMALWLESYVNVILLPLIILILLARIFVEEDMLSKTLAGYREYMLRVKYRLIPGIW